MLKSPCKKNCDSRTVGCHSDLCPYGWSEYESAHMADLEHKAREYDTTHGIYELKGKRRKSLSHRMS